MNIYERELKDNDRFLDDVRRLGFSKVFTEFNGEGDNGLVDEPWAVRGNNLWELSNNHKTIFRNIAWSLLSMKKSGWMNDAGSFGTVELDTTTGRYTCRIEVRHITHKTKTFYGQLPLPTKGRLCQTTGGIQIQTKLRLKKSREKYKNLKRAKL